MQHNSCNQKVVLLYRTQKNNCHSHSQFVYITQTRRIPTTNTPIQIKLSSTSFSWQPPFSHRIDNIYCSTPPRALSRFCFLLSTHSLHQFSLFINNFSIHCAKLLTNWKKCGRIVFGQERFSVFWKIFPLALHCHKIFFI